MTQRPPTLLVVLAVPIVALIAVLVTRAIEGPSTATAKAGPHAIVIKNFAFTPATLTVAKGTTLKVTNADGTTHTFSAKNGAFSTGELAGGKSATVKLNTSGTFSFYCKIHNYMTGTLVVK